MPKLAEEGAAGFFEDIPVLIVVLIATGIFLYSLVHAYVVYLDNLENQTMADEAVDLQDAVRGYEGLIMGFEEGVFSGDKLISLSLEELKENFNPQALGYDYQVSIIDTSSYQNSLDYTKSFATSEPPARGERYSVTTSVLILVEDTYHAGQLIVMIWS
jgi:hypothetical protein